MYALTEPDRPDRPDEPGAAPIAPPQSWWAQARCNDGAATMTGLFFSEDLLDIARAKAICSKCAARPQCLEDALARHEPWGVWGGELLVNGRVLAQKRHRGRPPKQPRPDLVVDELGRRLGPSVA